MNYTFRLSLLWLALLVLITTGCGGGGGGGGGSSTNGTYTGSTNQATLTQANAAEISTSAYENASSSDAIGVSLALQNGQSGESNLPRTLRLTEIGHHHIRAAIENAKQENSPGKALESDSGTQAGDCGGTATYSITVDTDTGVFSGSLTFTSFCQDGATVSGSISFTGEQDINGEFASTILTFTSLSVTTGTESLIANGTITTSLSGSTVTLVSNMVLTNTLTSETYKTENLTLLVTDSISSTTVAISGRFYHPVHGYVTLTTPVNFVIVTGDDYPSSGKLVATGANGTSASLTALSNTTYQLDVDTDGNGTTDSTTTGTWGA